MLRLPQKTFEARVPLYRLGTAYMAAHDPASASSAFQKGLELEPGNRAMALQAEHSKAQAKYEEQCRAAYQGLYQRDLVLRLRTVSNVQTNYSFMAALTPWPRVTCRHHKANVQRYCCQSADSHHASIPAQDSLPSQV